MADKKKSKGKGPVAPIAEEEAVEEETTDEEVEESDDDKEEEEEEEEESDEPASTNKGVVFVSRDKHTRAQDITLLVTGKRPPRTTEEQERLNHYAQLLAAHEVDLKKDDVVLEVYKLLGGLVRTHGEQAEADKKAKAARIKQKRRRIE